MDATEFDASLLRHFPKGTVLRNPGGGTTTVLQDPGTRFVYRRGKSTLRVRTSDLYAAYKAFRGRRVASPDLKAFAPAVFDSSRNGHSCNCTTLFMILKGMGLATTISGRGVRGDPFWVEISK